MQDPEYVNSTSINRIDDDVVGMNNCFTGFFDTARFVHAWVEQKLICRVLKSFIKINRSLWFVFCDVVHDTFAICQREWFPD